MKRVVDIRRLGRVPYAATHELQEQLQQQRIRGEIPDTLLLLEHERVVTLGRAAKEANLLLSRDELFTRGFEVADIGRGGDVTYHGPGQLVAYPIFDLKPDREDVRKYVWSLEEAMIRAVRRYGIEASRVAGFNGAWVDGARKIGAVGVRLSRWVTMHGLALNVSTNLDDFRVIVPCGIADKDVTSIERETGRRPAMSEVEDALTEELIAIHESDAVRSDLTKPQTP